MENLKCLYIARIRATIEDSVQVYGCLINGSQAKRLEDIQLHCCQIILGSQSRSYASNLASLGLEKLETRRTGLLKFFAISVMRSSKHNWWFSPPPPPPRNTRLVPPRLLVPKTYSATADRRPMVVYTKILNSLSEEQWKDLNLPDPKHLVPRSNVQLCDLEANSVQKSVIHISGHSPAPSTV